MWLQMKHCLKTQFAIIIETDLLLPHLTIFSLVIHCFTFSSVKQYYFLPKASAVSKCKAKCQSRALDKREYLMIIFLIFHPNHMLSPLICTVSLRWRRWGGCNICLYAELTKIIPNYHQILPLMSVIEEGHFVMRSGFWQYITEYNQSDI